MIERIRQIMELEELSSSQFADAINLQRSSLSHVLSGRNKPSLDFVKKIKLAFNRINLEWLVFGEGSMFVDQNNDSLVADNDSNFTEETHKSPMFTFESKEDSPIEPSPSVFDSSITVNTKTEEEKGGKRVIILYENGTYEEFSKI